MKPRICEDSELGGRELGGNTVNVSNIGKIKIPSALCARYIWFSYSGIKEIIF